jgi:peptidoglycan/LPS O-acetylase OafA/YrhL
MKQPSQEMDRVEEIDILRGMAIFGVVTCHTIQNVNSLTSRYTSTNHQTSATLFNFLNLGRYGVELFFIISGYLIGYIKMARKAK